VPLFIDQLPLRSRELSIAGERRRVWYALVPAVLTDPNLPGPDADTPCRWWKFDSACTLDACAWQFHIERGGLNPFDADRLRPQELTIRTANDAVESLPIQRAAIWLVSNIPALRQMPYRLSLLPGLPFYPRSPRRTAHLYPLLGMGAFHRARLKVKIDFDAGTLSVWTPGPWYSGAWQFLRRLPGRFATLPPDRLCTGW
jgi:hypothetical protein